MAFESHSPDPLLLSCAPACALLCTVHLAPLAVLFSLMLVSVLLWVLFVIISLSFSFFSLSCLLGKLRLPLVTLDSRNHKE
eukprot:m.221113 g.221113  ORF g.221113 m.221113 type:complete len:81 (+) comp15722_c0_seq1:454-696(+)